MKLLLQKKKMNILKSFNVLPDKYKQESLDSLSSFIKNENQTSNSREVLYKKGVDISKVDKKFKQREKNEKAFDSKITSDDMDIIDILSLKEKQKSSEGEENLFENIFGSVSACKSKRSQEGKHQSQLKHDISKKESSILNTSVKNEAQNILRNIMDRELRTEKNVIKEYEEIKISKKREDSNLLDALKESKAKVNQDEESINRITENFLKNSMIEDIANSSNKRKCPKEDVLNSSREEKEDIVEKKVEVSVDNFSSKENVPGRLKCPPDDHSIPDDKYLKKGQTIEKQNTFNHLVSYLENDPKAKTQIPTHQDNSLLSKTNSKLETTNKPIIPSSNPEVLNLMLELKECKKTIETMKTVIEELRNEMKIKDSLYTNDIQDKVKTLQTEYERKLSENQNLLSTLEKDKSRLLEEKQSLEEEIKCSEKNFNKKIGALMENFELERKKDKEAWYVAEKARRLKWEEQKIQEIKDNTIKGLEPEIEKILQSHKSEMFEMEETHAEEMKRLKEKMSNHYESKISELKERFMREKEDMIEGERNTQGNRFKNQLERIEHEHYEERKRWNSNLNAEISRIELLREKDKKQYEDEIRKNEERYKKNLDEKETYFKSKIAEMETRFVEKNKLEIEDMRLKYEKEKDRFVEEKHKEYENKWMNMKKELKIDQEKQIELIISKLGDETISERRKIQAECEQKADSINKQLKIENEQIKNKLHDLSEKLSAESKVRIMLDDTLETLSKKVETLEREIFHKEKKIQEMTNKENDLQTKLNSIHLTHEKQKGKLEKEFLVKFELSQKEVKELKEAMENLKQQYEAKINEMKTNFDYQIHIIDTKVKQKLENREEKISMLQDEMHLKDLTIKKLEELLEKQRNELLLKG